MQVKDRVCVVTGGGSGIGKALCERFHADGARKVVVVDRDADNAAAVAAAIGGQAETVDVGIEAEMTQMMQRVETDHGPIDVLCNNAGIASGGDPLNTPIGEWQKQWDVNVMSHVYAIRAVLPAMLARGEGHIQHTASMAGILTSHGNAPYATSKHAVVGLAEWMSITYHDKGIRTYLLAPLGVRTPMLGGAADSEWARSAAGPLKEPEEVAQQVTDAFAEERFLILTDEIAQEWMEFKTNESEKWLKGMRKLQARLDR
ncbi:MAG: NAD(P)-dependent dehydrogenase (short-subunit alcohol dehydrogenase family) [Acidimicrobiales bacterium]|jgi:NAD(P)-dependent dehydrogenase (short-subunit alcohol dehydrogenase family)